ncbi:MAG: class I SAM-dependent methyltransferase, partial [Lachnospiraceae bacterium]
LENFPFVFYTVDRCRRITEGSGLRLLHTVAADGASELLEEKINEMDDENYAQYLKYHFYICEKPEFLGMTNHLLCVCEK